MSNQLNEVNKPEEPEVYEIRIQGHLGPEWKDWFEELDITLDKDGDTVITGPVIDQAALHGLLKKVRDLGMPLISVNQVRNSNAGKIFINKEEE
jgi:hypothetical protein